MYEGMCLCVFYKPHRNPTVNKPLGKLLYFLQSSVRRKFCLLNALLLGYFGSTGRFTILQLLVKCEHTPHTWVIDGNCTT